MTNIEMEQEILLFFQPSCLLPIRDIKALKNKTAINVLILNAVVYIMECFLTLGNRDILVYN